LAALSQAFGVFIALLFSLLLMPAMYLIGVDLQQMRLARKHRKSVDADATEAVPASI